MKTTLDVKEKELRDLLKGRAGLHPAMIDDVLNLPVELEREPLVDELLGVFNAEPTTSSGYRQAIATTVDDIKRRVPEVETPAIEAVAGEVAPTLTDAELEAATAPAVVDPDPLRDE